MFVGGFDHKEDVRSLDLNVVRLCVQVVLLGENRSQRINISPVVSEHVYNKKTLPDPLIYRLSHCNSYVNGKNQNSEQIILLCTKVSLQCGCSRSNCGFQVTKDDIKIRFFETRNNQVVWEDFGTFRANDIYNNTAICFRPPKYHDQNITDAVKVWVQLVRPTDEAASPPAEFEYLPLQAGTCSKFLSRFF